MTAIADGRLRHRQHRQHHDHGRDRQAGDAQAADAIVGTPDRHLGGRRQHPGQAQHQADRGRRVAGVAQPQRHQRLDQARDHGHQRHHQHGAGHQPRPRGQADRLGEADLPLRTRCARRPARRPGRSAPAPPRASSTNGVRMPSQLLSGPISTGPSSAPTLPQVMAMPRVAPTALRRGAAGQPGQAGRPGDGGGRPLAAAGGQQHPEAVGERVDERGGGHQGDAGDGDAGAGRSDRPPARPATPSPGWPRCRCRSRLRPGPCSSPARPRSPAAAAPAQTSAARRRTRSGRSPSAACASRAQGNRARVVVCNDLTQLDMMAADGGPQLLLAGRG